MCVISSEGLSALIALFIKCIDVEFAVCRLVASWRWRERELGPSQQYKYHYVSALKKGQCRNINNGK